MITIYPEPAKQTASSSGGAVFFRSCPRQRTLPMVGFGWLMSADIKDVKWEVDKIISRTIIRQPAYLEFMDKNKDNHAGTKTKKQHTTNVKIEQCKIGTTTNEIR